MSSDPVDFVNVRQMFDPSVVDSQPKSLTGDRRTQMLFSETDMQSFSNTNKRTKTKVTEMPSKEGEQHVLQKHRTAREAFRAPNSGHTPLAKIQSQVNQASAGVKTS